MSIDATVGAVTANSYVTVEEADTFFADHYSIAKNTTWSALSTRQKESVLKRATQVLDSLRVLDEELGYGLTPLPLVERHIHEITIHRAEPYQALQFPRNIDTDSDLVPYIPQDVKDAQCEQAVYLVNFDESPLVTKLAGISEETVSGGPVRTHQTIRTLGTALAPMAWELMRKFVRPTNRVQRA